MKPEQAFGLAPTRLVYVCTLCPNVFTRRSTLKKHLLLVHKVDSAAAGFHLEQANHISAKEASQTRANIHGSKYERALKETLPGEAQQQKL